MSAESAKHLSPELSLAVGDLLQAGINMLRHEDAYHVGLLSHHRESPEVAELARIRVLARAHFRQLLTTVADEFDAG